jgi:hypothetical protein
VRIAAAGRSSDPNFPSVDQWMTQRKRLRHTHGLVNGGVTVRMEAAHDIAHNLALAVFRVGGPIPATSWQDAALGLQSSRTSGARGT